MNIQTHVYMQTLSLTLTYTRTHTQPRVYTGTLPNFTIVLFPSTLLFQRASFSNFFFFLCLFLEEEKTSDVSKDFPVKVFSPSVHGLALVWRS